MPVIVCSGFIEFQTRHVMPRLTAFLPRAISGGFTQLKSIDRARTARAWLTLAHDLGENIVLKS